MTSPLSTDRSPRLAPRIVAVALGSFWASFLALYTARGVLLWGAHQGDAFVRRVAVAGIGMALAWLMYELLWRLRAPSLRATIVWTAALSLPAAALFATANVLVFNLIAPVGGETCATGLACTFPTLFAEVSDQAINWSFVFAAWGMLYLSLSSSAQARIADRRAATHREAARLAEIRSLRYQINPHFLFNVLNCLLSLIIKRQLAEAEELVAEIGRFFRYSLAADPVADSLLSDEVAMQVRYLDLERRRFPSRLHTAFDVADDVAQARVPSLILQPLIENAIKHGVGRSEAPVTIAIRARRDAGRLRIVVEDDAPFLEASAAEPHPPAGIGIGLHNVAERLRARFGADASCLAGPGPGRGFRVELTMPLVAA